MADPSRSRCGLHYHQPEGAQPLAHWRTASPTRQHPILTSGAGEARRRPTGGAW